MVWRARGRVWLLWGATLGSAHARANEPEPAGQAPGVAAESEPVASTSGALEALERQALELRKQGKDLEALSLLQRLFDAERSPRALAQLAMAEQAVGRWIEARGHLRAALEVADDLWINEHRAVLQVTLREIESHVGQVEIVSNVAGAEVRLDGAIAGRTPLAAPIVVVAGRSVVELRADRHFDIARTIEVDPGRLSRIEVQMTAVPVPARVEAGAEPTGGRASGDLLIYGSWGGAALGLVTAVSGYLIREANVRTWNDDARCARIAGTPRSEECPGTQAAFRTAEDVALVGAATALVFGGIGLYLSLSAAREPAQAGVACGVHGLGFDCAGRF